MRRDRGVVRYPCILNYAGHCPPANYGPTYPSLGVSFLNTLVDYLLHQMHLMPSDVIQPCPRTGPVLAVDCKTSRVP